MMSIRRLDHVAILVENTELALQHFRDRLGLTVTHREELTQPRVRLTYLDTGNAFLQLVEPLDDRSEAARSLAQYGEGIHHICFGVDNALKSAQALSVKDLAPVAGTGRGRVSAFVPGPAVHGVRIECTAFDRAMDVEQSRGWIDSSTVADSSG